MISAEIDMAELYSREAEQAILADIISTDGLTLPDILATGLQATDFYDPRHAALYSFLIDRADAGDSLEKGMIYEAMFAGQLAQTMGGIAYVSGLADNPPLCADPYIELVQANATRRRLDQLGPWLRSKARSPIYGNPRKHINAILESVDQAWERLESKRPAHGITADEGARDLLDRLNADPEAITYSPTGIDNLDAVIDGFSPGELIVLAGRSSMGKSAGAVCLTLNQALSGSRIAFATLEMPAAQQVDRYVSQLCGVPYRDMSAKGIHRLNLASRQKIQQGAATFSTLPIHIRDTGIYTLREIRSYARRQQAEHRNSGTPLAGLVVDYIGLMSAEPGERRHEATTRWIKGFKELAKELGIWVLCLAQINRAAESLEDSVPRISNLADSTMMENTADIVILCYRRHYYDDTAPEFDVDWIIGKQRGGARNKWVQLSWEPTTGRHFDRIPIHRIGRA